MIVEGHEYYPVTSNVEAHLSDISIYKLSMLLLLFTYVNGFKFIHHHQKSCNSSLSEISVRTT